MAYGLAIDLIFFDDDNSSQSYSLLDDTDEFDPLEGELYRSKIDGTSAAKSGYSDIVFSNIYSFHVPGEEALIEFVQRHVKADRQAVLGLTPIDETGPNTILLVTDPADFQRREAEGDRVFLVADSILQNKPGFRIALAEIAEGPSIEDEAEDGAEPPEALVVVVPAAVLLAFQLLGGEPAATDKRFFVGSRELDDEGLTAAIFAALNEPKYQMDLEGDGVFYAFADSDERSVSVATVLSLPPRPWSKGLKSLLEVSVSGETETPMTKPAALEKWARAFGLCVVEESDDGAATLHLKGMRRGQGDGLDPVEERLDPDSLWPDE